MRGFRKEICPAKNYTFFIPVKKFFEQLDCLDQLFSFVELTNRFTNGDFLPDAFRKLFPIKTGGWCFFRRQI